MQPIYCRDAAIADPMDKPGTVEVRGVIRITATFVVVALLAVVSGIIPCAVLTGRVHPRRGPGVPLPDPKRVHRWAVAAVAGNASVVVMMLGFLIFPNSILTVAAAMLPVWIVCLVLILRIPSATARPRR